MIRVNGLRARALAAGPDRRWIGFGSERGAMFEIKFIGRGGQGVVVASQILGEAFFRAGWYPQCFSVFGGERRGAPLVGYLRADRETILLKCEISHPTDLICLDQSLLDYDRLPETVRSGGRILINTGRGLDRIPPVPDRTVAAVDASAIAAEMGLGRMFNTALLGAYASLAGQPGMSCLLDAVQQRMPAQSVPNLEAVQRAHDAVSIRRPAHD
jgi:2-oxoacid:acceptor oxidoreductase gamma subunit (pyruvate/2-ketoisovalerate family)